MARDLIAAGWQPGPAIGEELRRQRRVAQDLSELRRRAADLNPRAPLSELLGGFDGAGQQ